MLGNISVSCRIFVCPAYGVVCQQTVSHAKHTENVAQQPDLIAAVNVVCEQTILYAEYTENSAQLHSNQIYLLQSMPLAEHTENSVPYPDFLLRSFSHFESFLTADQPFLVDNYCDSHWARLPSQEAAA